MMQFAVATHCTFGNLLWRTDREATVSGQVTATQQKEFQGAHKTKSWEVRSPTCKVLGAVAKILGAPVR